MPALEALQKNKQQRKHRFELHRLPILFFLNYLPILFAFAFLARNKNKTILKPRAEWGNLEEIVCEKQVKASE